MRWALSGMLVLALSVVAVPRASAQGRITLAKELAEFALKKFGKQAAGESAEALSKRIATAAARHGDDAVEAAIRRVGPRAISLADDAGEHGAKALKLLADHGDDAAVWVVARPNGMRLLAEHGDDTAALLIRHKGVAEPLIEKFGKGGIHALEKVGPQNGRRLAMLQESGELARIGRTEELMGVVAKHGDKACEWVWRNKGGLAVGTTLAAFLADPEPFLQTGSQAATAVAEHAIRPVAEAGGKAAEGLFSFLTWAIAIGAAAGMGLLALASCFRPTGWLLKLLGKRLLKSVRS